MAIRGSDLVFTANADIDAFMASMQKMLTEGRRVGDALSESLANIKIGGPDGEAFASVRGLSKEYNALTSAVQTAQSEQRGALMQLIATNQQGSASYRQLLKDIEATAEQQRKLQRAATEADAIMTRLSRSGSDAGHAMTKGAEQASQAYAGTNNVLTTTHMKMLAIAAAGVEMAKSMISANAQQENSLASFTTLLGSAQKARDLLKDIQKFAAETPYEQPELLSAMRNLIAFGVKQQDAIKYLRMMGDVASGVKVPIQELSDVFGKNMAQGRLYMIDVNQFAMRGIPIWDELAKIMKTSTQNMRSLVSDGKVGTKEMIQAFENMVASGGKFNNMMLAQSKTFSGLQSTLNDNLGAMMRTMGQPVFEVAKTFLEAQIKLIDGPVIKAAFERMGKLIATAVKPILGGITTLAAPVADIIGRLADRGADVLEPIARTFGAMAQSVADAATQLAGPLKSAIDASGGAMTTVLLPALQLTSALFTSLVPVAAGIIQFFGDHPALLQAAAAAWTAYHIAARFAMLQQAAVWFANLAKMVRVYAAAVGIMAATTGKATAAKTIFFALLRAHPYAMIATAVGIVVAALVALRSRTVDVYAAQQATLDVQKRSVEATQKLQQAQLDHAGAIKALADQFVELASKAKRTDEENRKLAGTYQNLRATLPHLLKDTKDFAGALDGVRSIAANAAKSIKTITDEMKGLSISMLEIEEKQAAIVAAQSGATYTKGLGLNLMLASRNSGGTDLWSMPEAQSAVSDLVQRTAQIDLSAPNAIEQAMQRLNMGFNELGTKWGGRPDAIPSDAREQIRAQLVAHLEARIDHRAKVLALEGARSGVTTSGTGVVDPKVDPATATKAEPYDPAKLLDQFVRAQPGYTPADPVMDTINELAQPAAGAMSAVTQYSGRYAFPIAGRSPSDIGDDWQAPRGGGTRKHAGADIFGPMGAPNVAMTSGKIIAAGKGGKRSGLRVNLLGDDGRTYKYMHLNEIADGIREGVRVEVGQVLGFLGKTGNAQGTSPHTHFEIHENGRPVKPHDILKEVYRGGRPGSIIGSPSEALSFGGMTPTTAALDPNNRRRKYDPSERAMFRDEKQAWELFEQGAKAMGLVAKRLDEWDYEVSNANTKEKKDQFKGLNLPSGQTLAPIYAQNQALTQQLGLMQTADDAARQLLELETQRKQALEGINAQIKAYNEAGTAQNASLLYGTGKRDLELLHEQYDLTKLLFDLKAKDAQQKQQDAVDNWELTTIAQRRLAIEATIAAVERLGKERGFYSRDEIVRLQTEREELLRLDKVEREIALRREYDDLRTQARTVKDPEARRARETSVEQWYDAALERLGQQSTRALTALRQEMHALREANSTASAITGAPSNREQEYLRRLDELNKRQKAEKEAFRGSESDLLLFQKRQYDELLALQREFLDAKNRNAKVGLDAALAVTATFTNLSAEYYSNETLRQKEALRDQLNELRRQQRSGKVIYQDMADERFALYKKLEALEPSIGDRALASLAAGAKAARLSYEEQYGSLAKNMGLALKSVFDDTDGFVVGMSRSLANATMMFADSLATNMDVAASASQLALNIAQTFIQALIEHLMGLAIASMFGAAIGGPIGGAIGALGSLLGGNKALDAMGSGGASGPGLSKHSAGGYTGDAPTNQITGLVHGQEYVLRADVVRRLGRGYLDWLNAGANGTPPDTAEPIATSDTTKGGTSDAARVAHAADAADKAVQGAHHGSTAAAAHADKVKYTAKAFHVGADWLHKAMPHGAGHGAAHANAAASSSGLLARMPGLGKALHGLPHALHEMTPALQATASSLYMQDALGAAAKAAPRTSYTMFRNVADFASPFLPSARAFGQLPDLGRGDMSDAGAYTTAMWKKWLYPSLKTLHLLGLAAPKDPDDIFTQQSLTGDISYPRDPALAASRQAWLKGAGQTLSGLPGAALDGLTGAMEWTGSNALALAGHSFGSNARETGMLGGMEPIRGRAEFVGTDPVPAPAARAILDAMRARDTKRSKSIRPSAERAGTGGRFGTLGASPFLKGGGRAVDAPNLMSGELMEGLSTDIVATARERSTAFTALAKETGAKLVAINAETHQAIDALMNADGGAAGGWADLLPGFGAEEAAPALEETRGALEKRNALYDTANMGLVRSFGTMFEGMQGEFEKATAGMGVGGKVASSALDIGLGIFQNLLVGGLLGFLFGGPAGAAVGVGQAVAGGAVSGAAGGFATGGYTGDLPTDQIAGAVHGQEYVIPAAVVKRIGLHRLDRLVNDRALGSLGRRSAPATLAAVNARPDEPLVPGTPGTTARHHITVTTRSKTALQPRQLSILQEGQAQRDLARM
jgi:tape measure domain-containing protein